MCCLCFICRQSNVVLYFSGRLLQLQGLLCCQSIFHYSSFILIPSGPLAVNEHARKGERSLVTNFVRMSGLCNLGKHLLHLALNHCKKKASPKNPDKFPHPGEEKEPVF